VAVSNAEVAGGRTIDPWPVLPVGRPPSATAREEGPRELWRWRLTVRRPVTSRCPMVPGPPPDRCVPDGAGQQCQSSQDPDDDDADQDFSDEPHL
jgi:hypothetical protein